MPMTPLPPPARHVLRAGLVAFVLFTLTACGPKPPPPFEQAASEATDELVAQTRQLPAFLARVEATLTTTPAAARRGVVIDPMLDTATGEQTTATTLLEKRVTGRMTIKFDRFEFLPFQASNLSRAHYLLTGTMTRVPSQSTRKAVRINLALTDLKSGMVVAQTSTLAREDGLDNTPLRYYQDSPVLLKDKVIEGYNRTTASPAGQKADAYYLERIAAATLISEATSLYNAERYQEALGQYRNVLSTPEGEQLRTLSGIYLTSVKLGKTADAEKAFAKVVSLGFAYNELGVKFLFNPGSTEFWSDQKISGAYGMWLRQIARESMSANACLNIVGHTSNSGPAPANDALSLKRASYIRQRLTNEVAALGPRTKATGMGFHQNIVGSGTDDSFDALDRRVEFKIIPCT
jgi:outer membrane protein OmpA-like peptidoglycan-associated protein/predicted small lipoprotein YifL